MPFRLPDLLRSMTAMSKRDAETIAAATRVVPIEKGQVLLSMGELCEDAYIVISGGMRTVLWDKQGKEVTRLIALQGQFCSVLHSFIKGIDSPEAIEVFATGEAVTWTRETHFRMRKELPAWTEAYVAMLENTQSQNAWRVSELLGVNAAERYRSLMRERPDLTRNVPDRIIATYIGVAPEYLSRLKARELRKGS
jgi:CRP/FNR family transcriptional regulator, anaerobic regulatory protein